MIGLSHREFLLQDYALINPMQVALDQRKDLQTVRLLPKGFERHAGMMPLLLELRPLSESVRVELLERADRWSRNYDMPLFSALLTCDTDLRKLQAHLTQNLLLRRKNATTAWLRFHDPRVFRHLRWLIDDEQMACLLGPVTTWTWCEPLSGVWRIYERPVPTSSQRLRLTQEQWAAVDQFEALNRCLRDLAEEMAESPDDQLAGQLMDGLIEAQKLGLRDVADRSLYARQRLQYGVDFTRRDEMHERLRRVQEDGMTYVAACMNARPALQRENGKR